MTSLNPFPPFPALVCCLPGTAGVELLTTCMNNYFTRVISMILSYNGDVIKFAGDSMIVAFWPSEEEAVSAAQRGQGPQGVSELGALRRRFSSHSEPSPRCLAVHYVLHTFFGFPSTCCYLVSVLCDKWHVESPVLQL